MGWQRRMVRVLALSAATGVLLFTAVPAYAQDFFTSSSATFVDPTLKAGHPRLEVTIDRPRQNPTIAIGHKMTLKVAFRDRVTGNIVNVDNDQINGKSYNSRYSYGSRDTAGTYLSLRSNVPVRWNGCEETSNNNGVKNGLCILALNVTYRNLAGNVTEQGGPITATAKVIIDALSQAPSSILLQGFITLSNLSENSR